MACPSTPTVNSDLHGQVPDNCLTALLLVDVINELDFPEAEAMLPAAERMAEAIAALKKRARAAGIPVIYVNDNFGRWQSDFSRLVEHCLQGGVRGRRLAELLQPTEDDYSVLKPKHSGFFSTSLEVLLRYLGAENLIITGLAGNLCVLYTANDAYMRDYCLYVPSDCLASNTPQENDFALEQMAKNLKADTRPSNELPLEELAHGRGRQEKPAT